MTAMRVTLGQLYPDLMCTYGDRGNVDTILRRCGWRGIAADVIQLRLADRIRPGELDLIVIGSGGEAQQALIASDLAEIKGPGIREAVEQGAAALAVGAGYELFGHFCQPGDGSVLPGVGLFDAWTVRRRAALGGHYGTITEARADRAIGEVLVRWGDTLLVGFENHSGGTYLGPTAQPLGEVIYGYGNCGDGFEGVLLGSAVGTHLRGPCLPKNPQLADFLIGAALARRYGETQLRPLPDGLERAAHQAAIRRAGRAVRGPDSRLVRAVLRRPAPGMASRREAARGRLRRGRERRADSRAMGGAGTALPSVTCDPELAGDRGRTGDGSDRRDREGLRGGRPRPG